MRSVNCRVSSMHLRAQLQQLETSFARGGIVVTVEQVLTYDEHMPIPLNRYDLGHACVQAAFQVFLDKRGLWPPYF